MTKPLLLRTAVLLAVVATVSLLTPGFRWRLWGWLRGEAFYRCRPTSYWRGALRDDSDFITIDPESGPRSLAQVHRLADLFGSYSPPRDCGGAVTEAVALPVLLVLLDDTDEDVRAKAAVACVFLPSGPDPAATVPALLRMLREKEKGRLVAIFALGQSGTRAKAAVPALTALLGDESPRVREYAAAALKRIDPEAAAEAGLP
jgi:hypothetical protein